MSNPQQIIEPLLLPKAKGKLFIIGGHEDKEDDMDILTNFTAAAGGHNAHIVVIATASQVPEEIDQMYQPVFEKLGVKSYNFLALQSRAEASEAHSIDTVCRATGIILSGGTQLRLTTLLGGTPICEALKERYVAGAALAGTSAGASVLSDTIILRSPGSEQPEREVVTLGPGLGLVKDALIDQHFNQRGRLYDLLSALVLNPAKLGIGIDEDTALVVGPDAVAEVAGSGVVTIIDGRSIDYTDMPEVAEGQTFTVSGATLHVLTPATRFDLQHRTVIVPNPKTAKK